MSNLATNTSYRILVIDDNPTIHEDFRKILCPPAIESGLAAAEAALFGAEESPSPKAGFVIDSAYQGEEGLALVERAVQEGRPYSLAFVDVRMPPGWDGVETIRRIWEKCPEIQVVICTAYSDYSWEEIVRTLGQSDSMVILKKPFDNVEVLQLAHALTKKWLFTRRASVRMADLDRLVLQRTAELESANFALREEVRQRAAAQEALQRSEERFAKAFEASPIALAILAREEDQFLDVNDSFLRMADQKRDAVLYYSPLELNLWAQPVEWNRVVADVKAGRSVRHLATQVRQRGNSLRDVLLSVECLNLGSQPCLLLIIQDVTDQLKMEGQLRQSQKMEAVGQLAAGVAHDFNNILTVIQGHAALQLANENLEKGILRSFERIQMASERAAALTRQLLAFSRKQVMQLKQLDPSRLIGSLQKMLERVIRENIEIRCDCPEGLPSILADETNVEQVLLNLVVNARDAMPNGGQIEVRTRGVVLDETAALENAERRPGRFVCLSVSDNGTGMDASTLSHIFEPFFTTKQPGQGTGLGLSTVYGIVKQHRGWIEVTSEPGRGTTFDVYLPTTQDKAASGEHTTTLMRRAKDFRGEERILVVEDDTELRTLTCQTLRSYGYRVCEAEDGVKALEVFRQSTERPDLLLTDMIMPNGVNGAKLAAQLTQELRSLRVIYSSGYSPELVSGQLPLLEGINYLPKPYNPGKLLRTVRRCLDTVIEPAPASDSKGH